MGDVALLGRGPHGRRHYRPTHHQIYRHFPRANDWFPRLPIQSALTAMPIFPCSLLLRALHCPPTTLFNSPSPSIHASHDPAWPSLVYSLNLVNRHCFVDLSGYIYCYYYGCYRPADWRERWAVSFTLHSPLLFDLFPPFAARIMQGYSGAVTW
jgi:hypothetical protein